MSRRKGRRDRSTVNGVGGSCSLPAVAQPAQVGPAPASPQETLAETPAPSLKEEAYCEERKLLIDLEQKSSDQHDKAILTLTAGGFLLSITFLEKIAPNPRPETLWLIGSSWACFILSLFGILGSFLASQSACRRQRDILDQKLLGVAGAAGDDTNRWARWTHWLNVGSYGFFLTAVICLASFSWLNIPTGGSKDVAKQEHPKIENKEDPKKVGAGAVPPKPPVPAPLPVDQDKSKPTDKAK